jgi:hypothetical protein
VTGRSQVLACMHLWSSCVCVCVLSNDFWTV